MLKNKKTLISSLLIWVLTSIFVVIFGVTFLPKYEQNQRQADRITTVYTDSNIDFIIPSPSEEQVQDISAMEHVESVFSCYSIYSELIAKGKFIDENLLLVNNISDLENTMFKEDRILKQNVDFRENSLLIDETFASQHKLSLGDEVVWNLSNTESVRLVVDAIYFKNELDNVRAVVFNLGQQKILIDSLTENRPLRISKAYINSSDIASTNEMLKSYQPLGMLKTPEDFDLYLDYEKYIKEFNEKDYYGQIIQLELYRMEKSAIAENYQNAAKGNLTTFLILMAGVSFVVAFGVSLAMKTSQYIINKIRDGEAKLKTRVVYGVFNMVASLAAAICAFLTVILAIDVLSFAFLALLMPLLGGLINVIIQILTVNRAIKVKKR